MRVTLTKDELTKCKFFSLKCAENQQAIEFGQKTTKARDVKEIARDNLIGKIAETAFSRIMKEQCGIDVPLDFNYYPRGKWDSQDAVINGWRIDIKATRSGGHWFLIEWSKLHFRKNENKLSHIYVMFTVDWDREKDQPTGTAEYEGAAAITNLRECWSFTSVLKKGTCIPGTKARLQADNFGIPFDKLIYKDPQKLYALLSSSQPPERLTADFKCPE